MIIYLYFDDHPNEKYPKRFEPKLYRINSNLYENKKCFKKVPLPHLHKWFFLSFLSLFRLNCGCISCANTENRTNFESVRETTITWASHENKNKNMKINLYA